MFWPTTVNREGIHLAWLPGSDQYWLLQVKEVPTHTPAGAFALLTADFEGCTEDTSGAHFKWLCPIGQPLPSTLPVEPDVIHIARWW